ncbi:22706_t:CDS:1, partial [Racocetra persica]
LNFQNQLLRNTISLNVVDWRKKYLVKLLSLPETFHKSSVLWDQEM